MKMRSLLMTSRRTMACAPLFLFSLFICIQTSFAYDLNHVDGLRRHKRQTDEAVVDRFLKTNTGLIILVDRSKYVTRNVFYTEVMELLSNVLRYHVQNNKTALLTFASNSSKILNGFEQTIDPKCKLFEGTDAIWSKIKYQVTDESQNLDPNYQAALNNVRQISYAHTAGGGNLSILMITAGDDGTGVSPFVPGNIDLYVAAVSNAKNTDAIATASKQNIASITSWISALKKHKGNNMTDLDLTEFPEGDSSCKDPNPQEYCNPYTGSSYCTSCSTTNPQPFVMTSHTTTQAALQRLVASQCNVPSCYSSTCVNGQCRSPLGVSVCYCNRGFTGTNCEKSLCDACGSPNSQDCSDLCRYQPVAQKKKDTFPPFALIIPCAVGGFIILLVTILLICVCCKQNGGKGGGGGGGGSTTRKKKTPPPPPDPSLKPIGLVAPTSRPQRIRETTPEEDNLYAHYGKIPRHQNMPEWLGYIEEMVTVGHMEAAAIIKYDTSEWVCSERAFKVNKKEYDVLGRLLDKCMPNYKVKFKRREYFLIENDGETLVMESFNPRGEQLVVLARTRDFLVAVRVTKQVGLESAKNEVQWVKDAIGGQEL